MYSAYSVPALPCSVHLDGNWILKPIGVFGGTFDPIHFGHLRLAQELAEGLALGEVRFIPAGRPPHRAQPSVSTAQRVEMVRLAISGNPVFQLDEREIAKAGLSYTVDTLNELRSDLGLTQPICLLMGADAFLGLTTWHRWQELFDLAHIVIAHRPGFPDVHWADSMPDALRNELRLRARADAAVLATAPAGFVLTHAITPLDISATQIRATLAAGHSPRYLLPDAVLDYIQTHHLYIWNVDEFK